MNRRELLKAPAIIATTSPAAALCAPVLSQSMSMPQLIAAHIDTLQNYAACTDALDKAEAATNHKVWQVNTPTAIYIDCTPEQAWERFKSIRQNETDPAFPSHFEIGRGGYVQAINSIYGVHEREREFCRPSSAA